MRRAIQIGLLAALVVVCLLNVAVVRFIYVRYEQDAESVRELGDRVQAMEQKIDVNTDDEIGELSMENELLWVRVRRPGPLAKRRSKK